MSLAGSGSLTVRAERDGRREIQRAIPGDAEDLGISCQAGSLASDLLKASKLSRMRSRGGGALQMGTIRDRG